MNPPPGGLPQGAPVEAVKAELAKRLQQAIVEKGWNQSELARRAAIHMPDKIFGRDNVSNYIRGASLPGPGHLKALARALGKDPLDLLPTRGMPSVEDKVPAFDMRDVGGGQVWLRVNQAVSWDVATQIMGLLKGSE